MAPTRKTRSGVDSSSPGAMNIGGVRVRPTSKSLVVPAIATEKHWLALSNLDRVVNPTFSSVILFYKNVVNAETSFRDITGSLKDSLAKALIAFYPLAGRLALHEDGLVDLHCNDEGALFFEASVDAELAAVGGPRPMHALSGMDMARIGSGPKYIPDQLRSMPALIIMVTKFNCGSIALGINWHHTVADGSSGCHFVKSWAEVATDKQLSLAPIHDRSLLKPRNPPDASLVNGYSTSSVEELLDLPQVLESKDSLPTTPAILDSFRISKAAVQKIKQEASSEDDQDRQFTSAEAISALLWQRMTQARLNNEDAESLPSSITRFFMFVDGRKRLDLPPGYFGNVVCSACAVTKEKDILTKPLAYTANLIRTAVKSISGDYFRSLVDWVEIQGNAPSKSEHVNSLGHDVAATFWTFFPLYGMNFGFGKPELAVRNSPARPLIDGISMMPSPEPETCSMVALLNLHSDRMDKLVHQPEFKSAFCC